MLNDEVNKTLEVLKSGGIILYPTDTIWGLGCDATNAAAVEKIFRLKGRDSGKSMIILLDDVNKLDSYVRDVPEIAYDLIEYSEHPLTIVYSGAKNLAPNVGHSDGSIGIRIVKHKFCAELIKRFRKPIVSTSANISMQPSPANFMQISDDIINAVDYVVDLEQDDLTQKRSSIIMKLEPGGQFSFIRR
ncbi:L-threonylcarbamoyladenylate synthase [Hufsiella ginkgonis]|uniref:L-threonylcarbamoyladenylate synthase n=1 Tax=Hufsiella ginkgonis TaxID=2695274 RepID=A0A7K1Y415_9SPHI|nr:L-threonylcarbamoyladenylate synthase [Hufsiella ginkgonis]MXV17848.1 threonylcarbamoyl-AMP synthase [Hufsiella ginkgonis]